MATTLVRQPAHVQFTAPRGAIWAADLAVGAYRLLERIGSSRARRTLREAADHWDKIDPQRAAILRSAEAHLSEQLGTRTA